MLEKIIIISLIISGLMYCFQKWGVWAWVEFRKPKWIPMCYYCFGFWFCGLPSFIVGKSIAEIIITWFASGTLTYLIYKNIAV